MKLKLRALAAATGATTIAVAGVLSLTGGVAQAAPPSVPFTDPQVKGGMVLENSAGTPITSGRIEADPTFPFAVGSRPSRPGDNVATLDVFTPKSGQTANNYVGDQLNDSENYDPATQNPTNKGVTGAGLTLGQYIGLDPNARNTATDAYAGLYQLRLVTTKPNSAADGQYYQAVIKVTEEAPASDGSATGSWQLVEPVVTATSLSVSPASPQPAGTTLTLTATVNPAGAGTVTFKDGSTTVGSSMTDPSTGVATTTVTPAAGSHSYTASYAPADATQYDASASPATPYTITTATPPPAMPEAPIAALLPIAAGLVGAGVFARRRRTVLS